MALFFSSHRCNHLCRWLRLREFRLSHAEKHALNAVDTSGAAAHNTMTADDTGVSAGSGSGSTGSRMSTGHRRYKSWTRHATVLRVREHAASSAYVVQLPSLMCVCVCVCVRWPQRRGVFDNASIAPTPKRNAQVKGSPAPPHSIPPSIPEAAGGNGAGAGSGAAAASADPATPTPGDKFTVDAAHHPGGGVSASHIGFKEASAPKTVSRWSPMHGKTRLRGNIRDAAIIRSTIHYDLAVCHAIGRIDFMSKVCAAGVCCSHQHALDTPAAAELRGYSVPLDACCRVLLASPTCTGLDVRHLKEWHAHRVHLSLI